MAEECKRQLGVSFPTEALRGGALKLIWLCQQFTKGPMIDLQAQQRARGYILNMLGTTMFSDYSTNRIYVI